MVGRRVTRQCLVSWNSRTKNKGVLPSKVRGRFVAMKRASLRYEETPLSNGGDAKE